MRLHGAATGSRRGRYATLAALALSAIAIAACGEDDFENENRPPMPVEITALITDERVRVSPDPPGAGLVVITVANQSGEAARLTLEGPTDDASREITPGGTEEMKTTLEEGEYEVTAGTELDVTTDTIEVGPPRPSAQNDLLLP